MTLEGLDRSTEHLLRDLAPQVLAALARRCGDFAIAEDVVQDALMAAAAQWPADGVPENPRGWLYHVAVRRLADQLRSDIARRRREETAGSELWAEWAFVPPADAHVDVERDDSISLLFMCCHPSLTPASAIALTLRAVGGLTTAEIARAFFVPEATMAQRISRAKATIKASGVPFRLPDEAERAERLAAVLHVLYLIFNEGYVASADERRQRGELADDPIRLARMLHGLLPGDPEVMGLLALMLLTEARRAARSDASGSMIPLDEQDRSRWDGAMIAEGVALAERAMTSRVGPYALQAAIAALHDEAPSVEATDWPQIRALYLVLERLADNPVVSLNRAVAEAMVHGPTAGLELLRGLEKDPRLATGHRLEAVRAHLLERAGDHSAALGHYRSAAERTASLPERNYLLMKAARLAARARDGDRA